MTRASPLATVALALAALVVATSGCSRQDDRTGTAAVRTPAGATPGSRPTPTPVELPDLSRVAPSVRDQIQSTYSTLLAWTERPGAAGGEVANAFGEMGKLLLAAEFGQAAESCFLNAQQRAPHDMRWPYYLGHVYKPQGDTTKSMAFFEQALRLSPEDIATLIWLGEAYLTEDRLDPAGSMFSKALSRNPGEAAALAGLGRVALAKREYANAAKHLEEALVSRSDG